MTRKILIVVALFLNACTGAVSERAPSPCGSAPTSAACQQCLGHPPLGEVGAPICQTAVDAPAGSTCCSVAPSVGQCQATYVEDGREFTAACGAASAN